MKYIIISEISPMTSEQRCIGFSRELFKISRPVSDEQDTTEFLFGWIVHPTTGQYAMIVDLDAIIPVHPDKDLSTIISMLNPIASQEEVATIVSNIGTTVRFQDLLPSYVIISEGSDLEAEGWFAEQI
jgi:hypothetical protein